MGWATGGLVPLAEFKEAGDGCKAIQLKKVASADGWAVAWPGESAPVMELPAEPSNFLILAHPGKFGFNSANVH